jgi:1-deoxy-D-xylulose-5-phosphate reductoisomerase
MERGKAGVMKQLSVLGSTGSIGRNVLRVVEQFPDLFRARALAAHSSVERLAEQIAQFRPSLAVVGSSEAADRLRALLPADCETEIRFGEDGYAEAATFPDVDVVVAAMTGAAGLLPVLAAVEAGRTVALANKETLVMAGELVMARAAERNVRILPIDSEHSAIFQCLAAGRAEELDRILLTASGGPFREWSADQIAAATPEAALRHPNWEMGPKITIDSATLMNKGLEVIEARWLFDVSPDQIEVLVHPQSIVHSMVAFRDGSVVAQLGVPDMRGAIAHALSWPERLPLGLPLPDFSQLGSLTFESPDLDRFPALGLAFRAVRTGGTLPAVLNAANEAVVSAFLDGGLPFPAIAETVKAVMDRHEPVAAPDLDAILAADRWARETAAALTKPQ